MTHIDQRIRDWLAEADHEDWCDARVHRDCCSGKGCNCLLGPANAAIIAVLDIENWPTNDPEGLYWNRALDMVRQTIGANLGIDLAAALGITQEAASLDANDREGPSVAEEPTVYRVGDPDPTPNDWVTPCPARSPDGDLPWDLSWPCCWPAGHAGQHVAGDGSEILAVWDA